MFVDMLVKASALSIYL